MLDAIVRDAGPDAGHAARSARVGDRRSRASCRRRRRRRSADVAGAGARRGVARSVVADGRAGPAAAGGADPRAVVPLAAARLHARASRSSTAHPPLDPRPARALRRVARRTWRFFEELLAPADNWLIPDNYQENRADVIAHRTSPTNIGLQLLVDAGGLRLRLPQLTGVVDRLEPTFDTLLRMQRYRGHFYNWYDTRTLAPLAPPYISTVDSGNLAGYLLTLRSGLDRARPNDAGDRRARCSKGSRTCRPVRGRDRERRPRRPHVGMLDRQARASCARSSRQRPATLAEWRTLLARHRASG